VEGVASPENVKLRQMADGFIYNDDKTATHIHSAKLDAMNDLVESIGDNQIIIWSHFIESYKRIEKSLTTKLKIPKSKILNLSEFSDKYSKITEFKNKKYQYMISHPGSAGYGHTINCKYVIWMGTGIDSTHLYQANMRVKRIGVDKGTVMVYYLLCEDTLDVVDYDNTNRKTQNMKSYLNDIKRHISKKG
jgi:hypothetical protein